jgi:ParB family chromosome partitioning protein
MQVQHIPLSQLRRSPSLNVRKHGGANVADLVASIPAHSLLHPLVVTPGKGNTFDVVDGARRFSAIEQLANDGAWKGDVPCHVVTAEEAYEASLAGNTIREAMHPADEFDAFAALAKTSTAGEIGARYGKSEKYVAQRLRLGNLAPAILQDYREGKATLEQAMALTAVDDHKAQIEAWRRGAHDSWHRQPQQLRGYLLAKDIKLDSGIGKFVGVDAYKAAGGQVREDLFSDVITLPDGKLVDKIAQGKLDEAAKKLKAVGWGWVLARRSFGYDERQKYRSSSAAKPGPNYGAVVTIGNDGKIETITGLQKPNETPAKTAKKATKAKTAGGMRGSKEREARDQLYGFRTGVVRAVVRSSSQKALAIVVAAMAAERILSFKSHLDPATALVYMEGMGGFESVAAKGAIAQADPDGSKHFDGWLATTTALAKKSGGILPYFLAMDEAGLLKAMRILVARAIDTAGHYDDDESKAALFEALKHVGVDLGKAWKPTKEWLAKQPREYILAAIVEAKGKGADAPLAKLKAADLVTAALPLLAGWLPQELRAPAPKVAVKKAAKKKPAKKAAKVKRAMSMPMAPVAPAL